MVGNLGETPESAQKTMSLFTKLQPTSWWFSVAHPYPGTAYYREVKEKKLIETAYWCDNHWPVLSIARNESMTRDEINTTRIKLFSESLSITKKMAPMMPPEWERTQFYYTDACLNRDYPLISPEDLTEKTAWMESLPNEIDLSNPSFPLGAGWSPFATPENGAPKEGRGLSDETAVVYLSNKHEFFEFIFPMKINVFLPFLQVSVNDQVPKKWLISPSHPNSCWLQISTGTQSLSIIKISISQTRMKLFTAPDSFILSKVVGRNLFDLPLDIRTFSHLEMKGLLFKRIAKTILRQPSIASR